MIIRKKLLSEEIANLLSKTLLSPEKSNSNAAKIGEKKL